MRFSSYSRVFAAAALACAAAAGQLQDTYPAAAFEFIPPSGTGGSAGWCGSGSPDMTSFTLGVADAFVLSRVRLGLLCRHGGVGDLTLTLTTAARPSSSTTASPPRAAI